VPIVYLVNANLPGSIVAEGLSRVPPFPPIAAKLLSLLSTDSVEFIELSQLVGTDPVFSARLLQYANSYWFGVKNPVVSVPHAITMLGLEQTRHAIVTLATSEYARGTLRAVELRRCWEHTVATAILCDELARACDVFTGSAYTAGIMHDIGRLGLLIAYPQEYESIIRHATEQCVDLLDFERERFGMHHTEAGRLLIEQWCLPNEFLAIAGRHHDPCQGEEVDLLRIVHVACRLADALGYYVSPVLVAVDPEQIVSELPNWVRQRFAVTADQLRARIDQHLRAYDSDRDDNGAETPGDTPVEASPPEQVSDTTPMLRVTPALEVPDLTVAARRRWPVTGAAFGLFAVLVIYTLVSFLLQR
jgi:HD-like signal output (HDOD) protein